LTHFGESLIYDTLRRISECQKCSDYNRAYHDDILCPPDDPIKMNSSTIAEVK